MSLKFARPDPDQRIHFLTEPDMTTLYGHLDPNRKLPQRCDLLNDCDHSEPARYRVWLANKATSCTDLGCIGHLSCETCVRRARAREGFVVEVSSL